MQERPDFDDSSPDEMAEALGAVRRSQQALREAGQRLAEAGANGVLIPLPGKGVQLYALVGTSAEAENAFLSGEATLSALEAGKAFSDTQPDLVWRVHEALTVSGGTSGVSLDVGGTHPKVFFIAGVLAAVEVLVMSLARDSA